MHAPSQVDDLVRRLERLEPLHRLARRDSERLAPGREARLETRRRVLDDEDFGRVKVWARELAQL